MRYLRNSRKPAAEVLEKSHSVLGPLLIISGKRRAYFFWVFFLGVGLFFFFCFSLVFPRENSSFLMFWTDLA